MTHHFTISKQGDKDKYYKKNTEINTKTKKKKARNLAVKVTVHNNGEKLQNENPQLGSVNTVASLPPGRKRKPKTYISLKTNLLKKKENGANSQSQKNKPIKKTENIRNQKSKDNKKPYKNSHRYNMHDLKSLRHYRRHPYSRYSKKWRRYFESIYVPHNFFPYDPQEMHDVDLKGNYTFHDHVNNKVYGEHHGKRVRNRFIFQGHSFYVIIVVVVVRFLFFQGH